MTRKLPAAVLLLPVALAAGLACNTLRPPRPAVEWDPSPAAVVLRATNCCGLVPQYYAQNYLPEAQVWGDGRIVWVESISGPDRRVLEATLPAGRLEALLRAFVDNGFFGWEDLYGDFSVTDLPTKCLDVALTSASKSVCSYNNGGPVMYHNLYNEVVGAGGASGVEFVPERAYLTAYPRAFQTPPAPDSYLNWPVDSFGLSLADAAQGIWVDGEALAFAWRVVNANSWAPLVREGEAYYDLVVLVPGISQVQPPAP